MTQRSTKLVVSEACGCMGVALADPNPDHGGATLTLVLDSCAAEYVGQIRIEELFDLVPVEDDEHAARYLERVKDSLDHNDRNFEAVEAMRRLRDIVVPRGVGHKV